MFLEVMPLDVYLFSPYPSILLFAFRYLLENPGIVSCVLYAWPSQCALTRLSVCLLLPLQAGISNHVMSCHALF